MNTSVDPEKTGLFADPVNAGPLSADYAFSPQASDTQLEEMSDEDKEYYEAYMAALQASYAYYLDPNFDPYDYTGYWTYPKPTDNIPVW